MIKQNNYMMDIYSSSPTNMYDYHPIFDFDDNLMDNTDQLPSIQSDVEKVKTDDFYDDCLGDVFGNCMEDDDVIFFKKDLQFVDCMWSATASCSKNGGVNNNNSNNCNGNGNGNNNTQIASAASSYSESGALPPAIVTGTTLITDTEAAEATALAAALRLVSSNSSNSSTSTTSSSSSSISSTSSTSTTTPPIVIKQEPLDPFDITSSSSSNNNQQQQQQQRRKYNNSYDKENKRNGNGHVNGGSNVKFTDIPPGGSLLRKSCQKSTTGRNSSNNSNATKCTRPDTPFSPHDEISTCIKGSNNISLSAALSASDFIDHLSRELQNTTKKRISLPFQLAQGGDINEVLDVLDELSSQQQDTIMTTATTITTTTNGSSSGIGCSLSLAIDDSGCSSSNSVNMTSPPATSSDCDSDGGDCSMGENSSCSREFSTSSSMRYKNLRHHISDHSYTRCNEMADEHPPLETPSDSDEEIDVVTLTDKKLPTNPSDRDLGALQYQVAHKMIWNGSKKFSHPCYEFSTPASISPVKSVANLSSASSSSSSSSSSTSSYSPKNAYNFSNDDYDFGQSSLTSALKMPTAASVASATMGKGRKRYFVNLTEANSDEVRPKLKPTSSSSSSASSTTSTPMINKRCRSKKFAATNATNRNNNVSPSNMDMVFPTLGGVAGGSSSSSNSGSTTPTPAMLKRQYSLDEADTIEKRNQHNDMERQRRIGLKNLFEALKKQIPTIRDKERAPKVNILREAAKLCQQLTEDEQTLDKQLQKLREKQRAHQELLHRLRSLKTE
ncbi:myc protein [Drosophila tropicalis]|uniref:myc protein n=1 Tax=Drosophila tropicalis TaxID=46794 RepID=UPI0035AB7208